MRKHKLCPMRKKEDTEKAMEREAVRRWNLTLREADKKAVNEMPYWNFVVRRGSPNKIIVFLCWCVRGKIKVFDFDFSDELVSGAFNPDSFCLAFVGSKIEGQILPDFPDKKKRDELLREVSQAVLREINDFRG